MLVLFVIDAINHSGNTCVLILLNKYYNIVIVGWEEPDNDYKCMA